MENIGYYEIALLLHNAIQVLYHRTERVLRVVDSQVAVLRRRMEGAQDRRAKRLHEMLDALARVLQRHHKMQARQQRSLITLQARQISRQTRDTTGIREALRRQRRLNVRCGQFHLARLDGRKAAYPLLAL